MEADASAYDQSDATGFIRLNALRLRLRAAPARGGSLEPLAHVESIAATRRDVKRDYGIDIKNRSVGWDLGAALSLSVIEAC
jgi:hypothetical protein